MSDIHLEVQPIPRSPSHSPSTVHQLIPKEFPRTNCKPQPHDHLSCAVIEESFLTDCAADKIPNTFEIKTTYLQAHVFQVIDVQTTDIDNRDGHVVGTVSTLLNSPVFGVVGKGIHFSIVSTHLLILKSMCHVICFL